MSGLNENTINYNETIGEHSFGVLAGITWQRQTREISDIDAREIPSDGVTVNALELAPVEETSIDTDYRDFSLFSVLGRINYSYKGKYLLTASIRRDGSSRLGINNRYAVFPSVALAWRVSDEDFIADLGAIDNLKIRASYGLTGNQGIDPYSTLATLSTGSTAILNGIPAVGARQGSLANPDLKWETTAQYDLGVEIGLFQSRLIAEVDFYYKKTEDLLLNAEVPFFTGFTTTLQNVGSLENRGVDIALTGFIFDKPDFQWSASLNISTFKNKVLNLGNKSFIATHSFSGASNDDTGQLIVGEPVGTFVGATFEGIDSETGDAIFADISGPEGVPDGVYDPVYDKGPIGNANPDFFGGFQNTLSYKNFDMQVFFQFSYGSDVYQLDVFQSGGTQLNSYTRLRENIWTQEAPNNATLPKFGSPSFTTSNSFFLQDGSFLRLRTLQFGYTIPTSKINWLKSFRVFLTGNNLFLIKDNDYLGFDPDVSGFGTNNTLRGYENLAYPQNRSFMIGAEISF